ncbi:MAG: hypothetical protein ACYS9X_14935 [Planctomycetota bacterium]
MSEPSGAAHPRYHLTWITLTVAPKKGAGQVVVDGRIELSDMPRGARLPVECSIAAYQTGRRIAPAVRPAGPVTQRFRVVD